MKHQHLQTRAVEPGIFQHLPVASSITKRRIRFAPDKEIDVFGFAREVVVQKTLGSFVRTGRPSAS